MSAAKVIADPRNPTPAGTQMMNGVLVDAQGYPLPSAEQVQAYEKTVSTDKATAPGQGAYDPMMAAPQPDSDNPFANGTQQYTAWVNHNNKLKSNQQSKEAWQKQHEGQRVQQPAPASLKSPAPATPFQSSGLDLTQEGKGESYTDSILQHYQDAGIPQTTNESKNTLDEYRKAGPSNESQKTLDAFRAQQPANMDPYYDYASKLTSAKIDNAMAARGSYGSSNATGQIGAAEMGLRAQQARDNASYGLQRYAQEGSLAGAADNQRNNFYGQESSLAGAADNQGNVQNGIQYQWTKGLNDMAGDNQRLGQDRNQQLWNNNFQLAAAKAGIYGAGANGAIADTGAATDAAINAQQGKATDALSNANSNANASNGVTAGLLNAAASGVSNWTKYNAGQNKPGSN